MSVFESIVCLFWWWQYVTSHLLILDAPPSFSQVHSLFLPLQYNKPSDLVVPEMVNGLQENLDVVVSLAERHYYNCDFKMCYKLTSM